MVGPIDVDLTLRSPICGGPFPSVLGPNFPPPGVDERSRPVLFFFQAHGRADLVVAPRRPTGAEPDATSAPAPPDRRDVGADAFLLPMIVTPVLTSAITDLVPTLAT